METYCKALKQMKKELLKNKIKNKKKKERCGDDKSTTNVKPLRLPRQHRVWTFNGIYFPSLNCKHLIVIHNQMKRSIEPPSVAE